jgi:hypothetical protein
LVQAVASLLCRPLRGGVVQVARGVPCRLSESRLPATWSVGILSAMYSSANLAWTTISLGPITSCRSLADLLGVLGGLYVDVCHPEARVYFELLFSEVTRSQCPVSWSCALLARRWARRVFWVCVVCLLASFVWFSDPISLINWIIYSFVNLI